MHGVSFYISRTADRQYFVVITLITLYIYNNLENEEESQSFGGSFFLREEKVFSAPSIFNINFGQELMWVKICSEEE